MQFLNNGNSSRLEYGERYAIYNGPTGVHLGIYPPMQIRPGHVKVKILAAGVCEADRRYVRGGKEVDHADYIGILGHDAIGKIERTTKEAMKAGFRKGMVVAILPHIIPELQKSTEAYKRGEIFRLKTKHLGMNANGLGVFSHYLSLPLENVEVVPPYVINVARDVANQIGLHWSAPLAELEHLACVSLGWRTIVESEQCERGANSIVRKLTNEGGNVLIAGAGWLSYLWLVYLNKQLPKVRFYITEPNLDRWQVYKRVSNMWGCSPQILSQSVDDDPLCGKLDLVINANASRRSVQDLMKWVRPDGHICLFSGIDNGHKTPILDRIGFVDLEHVHRKGGWAQIHLTDDPTGPKALASGSSGYQLEIFRDTVMQIPEYYYQMAYGITGIVLGLSSNQVLVKPNEPTMVIPTSIPYASKRGDTWPVLVDIFGEDDWPGRATHLKVVCHPWDKVGEYKKPYKSWIGLNPAVDGY